MKGETNKDRFPDLLFINDIVVLLHFIIIIIITTIVVVF